MSSKTGWAHENEFVTIIDEEHDGWGVGIWNKNDGAEIVEFDENGELTDGVPLFTDEDIQGTIDALEEILDESDTEPKAVTDGGIADDEGDRDD
ncbi:hypothetical protein [Natrinema sp. DC36]|uniref:hypothetical protein n=1 Tax=Natrinema sp. DC36 TaxID=2878680 RepID=UPI001CF0C1C6|nr:hypothetical protein [Natrinema sp. DC36]